MRMDRWGAGCGTPVGCLTRDKDKALNFAPVGNAGKERLHEAVLSLHLHPCLPDAGGFPLHRPAPFPI